MGLGLVYDLLNTSLLHIKVLRKALTIAPAVNSDGKKGRRQREREKCVCSCVNVSVRMCGIKEQALMFWCYCHTEESPTLCNDTLHEPRAQQTHTHAHTQHTPPPRCTKHSYRQSNAHTNSNTHLVPAPHWVSMAKRVFWSVFCIHGNSCWQWQKVAGLWHTWLISWVDSHTTVVHSFTKMKPLKIGFYVDFVMIMNFKTFSTVMFRSWRSDRGEEFVQNILWPSSEKAWWKMLCEQVSTCVQGRVDFELLMGNFSDNLVEHVDCRNIIKP